MEQPAATKIEPRKKGELKGHFESSHSPFGFIWQIADATGWTVDYILWGVNYQTLLMMLADAPRYIDGEQAGEFSKDNKTSSKQPKTVIGFFQSKLNG
jgi:hypothetical protein